MQKHGLYRIDDREYVDSISGEVVASLKARYNIVSDYAHYDIVVKENSNRGIVTDYVIKIRDHVNKNHEKIVYEPDYDDWDEKSERIEEILSTEFPIPESRAMQATGLVSDYIDED